MGVMVPADRVPGSVVPTRQIVICLMGVFTVGSCWHGWAKLVGVVLVGRVLEAAGTGVMWLVLQITVFSIYPPGSPRACHGHGGHG